MGDSSLVYMNVKQARYHNDRGYFTSLLFAHDKEKNNFIPVGHMDYAETVGKADEVGSATAYIKDMILQMERYGEEIPNWLTSAYEQFYSQDTVGSSEVAIRIGDSYQGRGLGKLLIALTRMQAEQDGYRTVNIGGDATRHTSKDGTSYYAHLGARIEDREDVLGTDSVDTGKSVVRTITFDTRLNEEQFEDVQRSFTIK